MMKKIHFLLLISLLLAACSDDDKEKQPAFVTNITISDAGKTFNPGDAGKMLGLGADVYHENDKTKYRSETYKCSCCGKTLHDVMLRSGELWAAHNIAIYGLMSFGKLLCDECQKTARADEKKQAER